MRSDIAFGNGTQQGVSNRVESDVGIRMAFERPVMRDFDPAQDYLVAFAKGMNVEPRAYPRFSGHGSGHPLRALQVFLGRNLEVLFAAEDERDTEPGIFGNCRIVGHFLANGIPVSCQNFVKAKSLRGLRAPDIFPVNGPGNDGGRAGTAFERIGNGDSRQNRGGVGECRNDPVDCRMINKGSSRVVNEYVVGVACFKCFQAPSAGILSGSATGHRCGYIQAGKGGCKTFCIFCADDDLHSVDIGVGQKYFDRAADDRNTAQVQILFRDIGSNARAGPSGENENGATGHLTVFLRCFGKLGESTSHANRCRQWIIYWKGQNTTLRPASAGVTMRAMLNTVTLSISAVITLVPAAILPYRRDPARDATFWFLLVVAIAGPLVWIWIAFEPGWRTGLASTLWITVATSLVLYGVLALAMREVWRLAPLLFPYLSVIGILATVWIQQPEQPLNALVPSAWVQFHILISVLTYALLTIGAVAGLAVVLQEHALKRKRPSRLTRLMPSVADGERIQVSLLTAGAVILGCGLLSGMAAQFYQTGAILEISHKTALSIATFAIIVILLAVHIRTGIRGRRAARYVLIAYLLITFAYPGVKFVTDVVLT